MMVTAFGFSVVWCFLVIVVIIMGGINSSLHRIVSSLETLVLLEGRKEKSNED